jgi:hypothetical protein
MRWVIICYALLLASCASTANYEKAPQSWVGASADSLVKTWGPPQSSHKLSDGGQVLVYVYEGTMHLNGHNNTESQTSYRFDTTSAFGFNGSYAQGMYSGTNTPNEQHQNSGHDIYLMCITRFTVNPQGTIISWAQRGNNCKARS